MMYQPEIDRLISAYKEHEKASNRERNKTMPSQPELNYRDEQMAKIEERFSKSDLDIRDYL